MNPKKEIPMEPMGNYYLNPPEPTFFVGSQKNSILGFILGTDKKVGFGR